MSNPDKRWSWGQAFGRAVGGATGPAATGFLMGSFGGPVSAPVGAAIGAASGFASGFLGTAIGFWWDAPRPGPEPFGSAALFTFVLSTSLSAVLSVLFRDQILSDPSMAMEAITGISAFSGFLASMFASFLDDRGARTTLDEAERERHR